MSHSEEYFKKRTAELYIDLYAKNNIKLDKETVNFIKEQSEKAYTKPIYTMHEEVLKDINDRTR